MKTILLAVGGNSLIRAGEKGTMAEQLANARRTAREIVGLIRDGYRIVLTHGNGPQVGAALLRSEAGASQVPAQPLDLCGAATQGEIGYILEQALGAELTAAGIKVPLVSMVTQTIISLDDPSMHHPSKPVGPFYSREEAMDRHRQLGWQIVEDAARGYRRVVPSPEPIEIVELEVIRGLVDRGVLVICCGGGGIPVARQGEEIIGVEAVIDKDRASALLASHLGADLFVISTDTDFVYLDYKKPAQRALHEVCAADLARYAAEGYFLPGSMGPKIQSVLRFLHDGGKQAIIASAENLQQAVAGHGGTHMYPDNTNPAPSAELDTIARGH
ncbi:MAG: carbamate kinase [Terriglobales bacterium]